MRVPLPGQTPTAPRVRSASARYCLLTFAASIPALGLLSFSLWGWTREIFVGKVGRANSAALHAALQSRSSTQYVKPAFNGTWTARRGCRRRPTRRHFLLLSALLRVDSAGPTGCRSGTAVAVDDPSTRTATIARVAGERFSAFCPNFPWWWGSLFCSPRGGAESPMMVFEPHSHREVPPSFVCMLSTRICSLYASACGRWDMRGPSGLRKFSSVQFPSERALSRRQPRNGWRITCWSWPWDPQLVRRAAESQQFY